MTPQIHGGLLTSAMAVMPHTDVARALEAALSLDIPFWPQLPHYSYYEDMDVQAAEHFPGIVLDLEERTLRFSMEKFAEELRESLRHLDDPTYFDVSETYSAVYHQFLSLDLSDKPAIRGQLEGPISFGFISQAMLSPATCCLINPDKERTVERAFAAVKRMAALLRENYLR